MHSGATYQHGFAGHRIQLRAEKEERQDASGADVGDGQARLRQRRVLGDVVLDINTVSHLRRRRRAQ